MNRFKSLTLYTVLLVLATGHSPCAAGARPESVPKSVQLTLLRAEDTRHWTPSRARLIIDRRASVRERATLAAGRIGDTPAVLGLLVGRLRHDPNRQVQEMAAFALGQLASPAALPALTAALASPHPPSLLKARAVEALGKIASALPPSGADERSAVGRTLLGVLAHEEKHAPNSELVQEALLALVRDKPTGPLLGDSALAIGVFLRSKDPSVRATAADTLARLHARSFLLLPRLHALLHDPAPLVRANAARALAAASDTSADTNLQSLAARDPDLRVRVEAIRALGALAQPVSTPGLISDAVPLLTEYQIARRQGVAHPVQINELLEIASALGQVVPQTNTPRALSLLATLRRAENFQAPELEIAAAQIAPAVFLAEPLTASKNWRVVSSQAQGLGALAALKSSAADQSMRAEARAKLAAMMESAIPIRARPDVVRARAALGGDDLPAALRRELRSPDVFVRATAAEMLGKLPPSPGTETALAQALRAARDERPNDAARYELGALAAQHTSAADTALRTALASSDQVVRLRAIALLRANGAGDFSRFRGAARTQSTDSDYRRALGRAWATARVATDKGTFTITLLPQAAPLTVDSFIRLARRHFFDGLLLHRVVPDFVVQGGDPRGDGNGGPGYALRDEINPVHYGRGTVGMALDGPDTGGSQWFVTHSPQPHLDGGYTVFGQVTTGMEVVDRLARGDHIQRVMIEEGRSK